MPNKIMKIWKDDKGKWHYFALIPVSQLEFIKLFGTRYQKIKHK